jgi:hypothetical protein
MNQTQCSSLSSFSMARSRVAATNGDAAELIPIERCG